MNWQPIDSVPDEVDMILGFSGMYRGRPQLAVYERYFTGSNREFCSWWVPGDHESYHDSPTLWAAIEPPQSA